MIQRTINPQKPKRLYFKSYIQLLHNSIGSNLFRNFYVIDDERGEFDTLDDGANSCAFFVSSILALFKKLDSAHGTVASTIKDLESSGWKQVNKPQEGDVLVWEALKFDDGLKEHIGFSIGNGRAISTSSKKKAPAEHDDHFGKNNRKIVRIYRMPNWE